MLVSTRGRYALRVMIDLKAATYVTAFFLTVVH